METTMHDLFGDNVICEYSRAEALEDGVLVDVTATAREAGFRIPVALTRSAYEDRVAWTDADTERQTYQDESGRLWDVLWMASTAARRARGSNASRVEVEVYRVPRDGESLHAEVAEPVLVIGPGDEGEPVATLMLPSED